MLRSNAGTVFIVAVIGIICGMGVAFVNQTKPKYVDPIPTGTTPRPFEDNRNPGTPQNDDPPHPTPPPATEKVASKTPEDVSADNEAESTGRCDADASHPEDPNRLAEGVSDKRMAVGRAIQNCLEAVSFDPKNARSQFQLGRAMWLANRYEEALAAFVESADMGYAPAKKFIGDAYLEGKGLPAGEVQDIHTALRWYKQSAAADFVPAEQAVAEVEDYIRTHTFNPNIFQNPSYTSLLYNGDFSNINNAMLYFAYTQGMFEMLDSEQVMDHDPHCKPLLNKSGQLTIDIGSAASVFNEIRELYNGAIWLDKFKDGINYSFRTDEGGRDAVKMIETYGCDSEVGKRIVGNLVNLGEIMQKEIGEIIQSLQ